MKRVVLVAALALAPACRDDKHTCPDPTSESEATDEAWLAMTDAEERVQKNDASAPVFTSPAEGEQLSASGGIMPVELTSDLFRHVSPWLPFTWVVRAFRASMFGAFDGGIRGGGGRRRVPALRGGADLGLAAHAEVEQDLPQGP